MMPIPNDVLGRVLDASDIHELIGRDVTLRGEPGCGPAEGCCPKCGDKMLVFREKRYFRCPGCGLRGSAIFWVMRRDNVGFRDAVKTLADKSGIDMEGGS